VSRAITSAIIDREITPVARVYKKRLTGRFALPTKTTCYLDFFDDEHYGEPHYDVRDYRPPISG
jgi:hypothetical protein